MAKCKARGLRKHSQKFELNPFSGLEGDVQTRYWIKKKVNERTEKIKGVIENTRCAVFYKS